MVTRDGTLIVRAAMRLFTVLMERLRNFAALPNLPHPWTREEVAQS